MGFLQTRPMIVKSLLIEATPYLSLAKERQGLQVEWLRIVGSLKLWVSFAGSSLFYKAPLRKRPMILRSLRIVATPEQTFSQTKEPRAYWSHRFSCMWLLQSTDASGVLQSALRQSPKTDSRCFFVALLARMALEINWRKCIYIHKIVYMYTYIYI